MPCCGFSWFSSSSARMTLVETPKEKLQPEESKAVPAPISSANSGRPGGGVDVPIAPSVPDDVPSASSAPIAVPHVTHNGNGLHHSDGPEVMSEPSTQDVPVPTIQVETPLTLSSLTAQSFTNSVQFGNRSHTDTDIVIAVMGATGVGKTTFIKSLTSSYKEEDSGYHGLDAGTKTIQRYPITLHYPDGELKLVLVDTPGFDDPTRPNAEVLEHIAEWLASTYREGRLLNGLIYLHRITDIRFDSGASSTLNLFRKIYGGNGYEKLALVTTMWNDVPPTKINEFETRETELRTIHWGAYVHRGDCALVSRYDSTSSVTAKESALQVVSQLLAQSIRSPELRLQLQRELVDQKTPLPRTEAGKAVFTLSETAKFYLKQIAA